MKVRGAEPDYNIRGLPKVSAGPMANAEMFGGAASRQLMDMGGAVQGLGQEVMRQDQVKRKEQDETQGRIATNDMNKRWADQKKILENQYQGPEAYKLPEEMAKLTKTIRDDIVGKLQNQHQIDYFSRAADAIESRAQIEAFGWRDGQMEIARQNSLDAQNAMITQEGADNAAGALTPDGIAANRGRLAQMDDNTRQRHRGQSAEYIDMQIRAGRQKFHQAQMAAVEPAKALEYLDKNINGAKDDLGPANVNVLRDHYLKATVNSVQTEIVNAETSRLIAIRQGGGDAAIAYAEIVNTYGTKIAIEAAKGLKAFESLIDTKDAQIEKDALKEARERHANQIGREARTAGMSEKDLADIVYADEAMTVRVCPKITASTIYCFSVLLYSSILHGICQG